MVNREVRIRTVRSVVVIGQTWLTRYSHPEAFLSLFAKPYLDLPVPSSFVRTCSTEMLKTYVASAPIACSAFVLHYLVPQVWCYLIPSCSYGFRPRSVRFIISSVASFLLFQFLTINFVVPVVWQFPTAIGPSHSLVCYLFPKISDHLTLTVRCSCLACLLSQFVPAIQSVCFVLVVRSAVLVEPQKTSLLLSRRSWMVVPLVVSSYATPASAFGIEIVASCTRYAILELALFLALVFRVGVLVGVTSQ
ncbi:uncharacterized tatC-like protein ymf16 [Glycine max]|uniref:uncharacterized tatC-like protein ymf16 n=1 Tax=Glycine max TaxID=3847 RepID=UPI0003DEA1D2|nr:uncharacterized tatC-like protein ymf16 [Glycine max]|eukprot:XP_006607051.1 uncharacterized protein LOC102660938 [Glycine max]